MPQNQSDEILDSITLENIDEAMIFYKNIVKKIMEKKKKYQQNEEFLMNQLKQFDIKKEIDRLKLIDSETESDYLQSSDSDTE